MKWKRKPKNNGTNLRRKKRFLFWPKCINDEWRWWEKAEWMEKYISFVSGNGSKIKYWESDFWINKEEKL